MTSRGDFVGQQEIQFVRLADDEIGYQPDPRFGVIATIYPFRGVVAVAGFAADSGSGAGEAGGVELARGCGADRSGGVRHAAGIAAEKRDHADGLPDGRTAGVGHGDRGQLRGHVLLQAPQDVWQPELAYLVSRHANHLDRWQFGADGEAGDLIEKPGMRKVYNLLYSEFRGWW